MPHVQYPHKIGANGLGQVATHGYRYRIAFGAEFPAIPQGCRHAGVHDCDECPFPDCECPAGEVMTGGWEELNKRGGLHANG